MSLLAVLPFALSAFWAGWVFRTLRDLAARQTATLEGVRA